MRCTFYIVFALTIGFVGGAFSGYRAAWVLEVEHHLKAMGDTKKMDGGSNTLFQLPIVKNPDQVQ